MDEPSFDPQGFASYSLSQLLFKDSSVEVGVRSVLRIAEHKGLTWWRLWVTLQLTPFNADTLGEDIARIVDEDFPEEKAAHRGNLYTEHFNEYRYLRWDADTRHYTVDGLAKLEKITALAEVGYARGHDDLRMVVFTNADVLSRIKSRVQDFLTAIERGYAPRPPKRKGHVSLTSQDVDSEQ
jgi:hypothetical protein